MAKKIEGWAWPDTGNDTDRTGSPFYYVDVPGTVNATLVIHEGKPERVYTQSELQAMLDAVDAMEHFTGAQVQMLMEFGITLDPTE